MTGIREKLCKMGIHEWYIGNFSRPVKYRYERRCIHCEETHYKKVDKWVSYRHIKQTNLG